MSTYTFLIHRDKKAQESDKQKHMENTKAKTISHYISLNLTNKMIINYKEIIGHCFYHAFSLICSTVKTGNNVMTMYDHF